MRKEGFSSAGGAETGLTLSALYEERETAAWRALSNRQRIMTTSYVIGSFQTTQRV